MAASFVEYFPHAISVALSQRCSGPRGPGAAWSSCCAVGPAESGTRSDTRGAPLTGASSFRPATGDDRAVEALGADARAGRAAHRAGAARAGVHAGGRPRVEEPDDGQGRLLRLPLAGQVDGGAARLAADLRAQAGAGGGRLALTLAAFAAVALAVHSRSITVALGRSLRSAESRSLQRVGLCRDWVVVEKALAE